MLGDLVVKRYAIVRNNIVENVVLWDGVTNWGPPSGCDLVDITDLNVGPKYIRNEDGTFSPPPEEPTE